MGLAAGTIIVLSVIVLTVSFVREHRLNHRK